MVSTQTRHDDVIIQRRFGENTSTHAVKQIYAVTYPGHSDQGTERGSYDEAERIALTLAEEKGLSVWYRRILRTGGERSSRVFGTRTSAFTSLARSPTEAHREKRKRANPPQTDSASPAMSSAPVLYICRRQGRAPWLASALPLVIDSRENDPPIDVKSCTISKRLSPRS